MLPDMDMQIPSPVRDALELGLNSRHRAGSIFNTCIRASTDEDRYMINYAVNDARSVSNSLDNCRCSMLMISLVADQHVCRPPPSPVCQVGPKIRVLALYLRRHCSLGE